MREIRFRAWDVDSEIMININEYDGDEYSFSIEKNGIIVEFLEEKHYEGGGEMHNKYEWVNVNAKIMQFTGLKDKNGNDIYEHDLIKSEDGILKVVYSNKFASFCLEKEGWAFLHYFGEAVYPENVEVVGNIYENPELLCSK